MDKKDMFISTVSNCSAVLCCIQAIVDNHFGIDPDKVNYGDIGSANMVLNALENILKTMKNDFE